MNQETYQKTELCELFEKYKADKCPALMDVKFPNLEMTHVYNGISDWDNFLVYKKI
jgi:hypothetical protein